MRERFLEWGAGLSEEDFACALAAFGVLGGRNRPPKTKGVLDWRFDPRLFDESAAELAKAWRTLLEHHGGAVSLRLDRVALLLQTIDPYWLQSRLARAPGAGRIILADETRFLGRGRELASDDLETDPGRGLSYAAPGEEERTTRNKPEVKSRPRKPESRRLQAQLIGRSYPDQRRRVIGALRPGKNYSALIGVGLPAPDRKDVGRSFPDLGDDPKGHDLTVIWEPLAGPGLEARTLHLPPDGDSGTVEFQFKAPADARSFEARVTVLHANRVLQTGLLNAPVGEGADWKFELDATPRTRLEGLSARTEFDVALVLSHDEEGTARGTAVSGDRAAVISLDDGPLDALTDFLRKQISKIAKAPERYETLSSPGTLDLLRTLAQKGGALHEDLCLHTDLPVLAEAKRIHLTSAKVGSFFPVELLYRYEPPDDTAKLCPNAAVALQTGDCPGGCPADKRQHVCPLGFWGLSRIIERHTHTAKNRAKDKGGDFLLQPEPVQARSPLALSNRSLVAASGRASEVKKEAVDELLQALGRRGTAARATSWPEWIERVESDRPSLLVLLPHHEEADGEEILEIGEGDRLKSSLIRPEHVRREDGPYPILLLLGCETNLARIAFDNFATRFRDKQAAVVVSTIATILGRHASPAAAKLVELLDEEAREEDSTFGEVMVRLRRKLVEAGNPMALGLTAYGDADWILTRKADADDRDAPRPLR